MSDAERAKKQAYAKLLKQMAQMRKELGEDKGVKLFNHTTRDGKVVDVTLRHTILVTDDGETREVFTINGNRKKPAILYVEELTGLYENTGAVLAYMKKMLGEDEPTTTTTTDTSKQAAAAKA